MYNIQHFIGGVQVRYKSMGHKTGQTGESCFIKNQSIDKPSKNCFWYSTFNFFKKKLTIPVSTSFVSPR
jgi:hypothetical protein